MFQKEKAVPVNSYFCLPARTRKNNQNNLLRTAWYTSNISVSLYASLKYVTQIHNTHTVPCFWQLIRKLWLIKGGTPEVIMTSGYWQESCLFFANFILSSCIRTQAVRLAYPLWQLIRSHYDTTHTEQWHAIYWNTTAKVDPVKKNTRFSKNEHENTLDKMSACNQ